MAFMLRCPATSHRLAVGISDAGSYIRGQVKEQILRRGGPFGPAVSVYWGFWGKTTGEQWKVRAPWLLGDLLGIILPSYVEIIIYHYVGDSKEPWG